MGNFRDKIAQTVLFFAVERTLLTPKLRPGAKYREDFQIYAPRGVNLGGGRNFEKIRYHGIKVARRSKAIYHSPNNFT